MPRFIGFDKPKLNENFFELSRTGKPYLSLYHDCKVTEIAYAEGGAFVVQLQKVHDTGYGPSLGQTVKMVFEDLKFASILATMDGNFEDVDEIVYLGDVKDKARIDMVISGIKFGILCSKIELIEA